MPHPVRIRKSDWVKRKTECDHHQNHPMKTERDPASISNQGQERQQTSNRKRKPTETITIVTNGIFNESAIVSQDLISPCQEECLFSLASSKSKSHVSPKSSNQSNCNSDNTFTKRNKWDQVTRQIIIGETQKIPPVLLSPFFSDDSSEFRASPHVTINGTHSSHNDLLRSSISSQWQEFGALSDESFFKPETRPQLSWTVQDVRPCFSKVTYVFCESVGINSVIDLLKADSIDLSVRLFFSSGFRLACTMAAWRSKENYKHFYRLSTAKESILQWKSIAETWWKTRTLKDDRQRTHEMLKNIDNHVSLNEVSLNEAKKPTGGCKKKNGSSQLFDQTKFPNNHVVDTLRTPVSSLDYFFLVSRQITTDVQVSQLDESLISFEYHSFLEDRKIFICPMNARDRVVKWKQDARKVLNKSTRLSNDNNSAEFHVEGTRLDHVKSSQKLSVMENISHLCTTTLDKQNCGLPTRTIYTFDHSNDVIYHFRVNVEKSMCSENSGNGAFLTYTGCKILKKSCYWKRIEEIPPSKRTRRTLTACFGGRRSTITVTLKGQDIHGDEHFYGPVNGVGKFNEYSYPNDFVDVDNITFSSKFAGCALIELDRYAPLLPEDRKIEIVFSIKDWIFSHEPSAWRFNVKEEIDGHPQVVDFTDDTTGSPHHVARSHLSMYVNEVGHNMNLTENVCPLETPRSVSYYIYVDKPMMKGDKVELLVNYGKHYEEMRERRGYGILNLRDADNDNDDPDYIRMQRNLKHRILMEDSLLSCSEHDIQIVLDFLSTRVWGGILKATSCPTPDAQEVHVFRRQCIVRRRLHWISEVFRIRLFALSQHLDPPPTFAIFSTKDTSNQSIFFVGMIVFVNNWMSKEDPRPSYSGLATIESIATDHCDRLCFNLSLSGSQKSINRVPEGVVTLPTEKDFNKSSSRLLEKWKKTKFEHGRPRLIEHLHRMLDQFNWDPTFISPICSEVQRHCLEDFRRECSEELLFRLRKNACSRSPVDNSNYCLISQSMLVKALRVLADHILWNKVPSSEELYVLRDSIISAASDAATSIREKSRLKEFDSLSFCQSSSGKNGGERVIVVKTVGVNRVSVQEYHEKHLPVDVEWYLGHQIVTVIHPLASLIDWRRGNTESIYSIRLLCETVGIDVDSPIFQFGN